MKQDVARWQTEKIRELRPQFQVQIRPVEIGEHRDLNILLGNVRRFWVEGVLERSMRRERLLELKDTQPDAVENPWETVLQLPYRGSSVVPLGKSIFDVFVDVERFLLILGQPGSGKTTTLLTLVRELIMRAQRDINEPIPVVFNLSSWAATGLPRRPGSRTTERKVSDTKENWQGLDERHRILPLLDGLDELGERERVIA